MAFATTVRRAKAVSGTGNSTSYTPTWTWVTNTAVSSGVFSQWIAIISSDGGTASAQLSTTSTGWIEIGELTDGTSAITGAIYRYESTAAFATSAAPALQIDSTATEQYSAILLAFVPATANFVIALLTSTSSSGSSTNPNPALVTNNTGASRDLTVVAGVSVDSTTTPSAAPTNYANLQTQAGGGTNGATSGSAERQITVASASTEDPGVFTMATDQWVCWTLGVYERAAASTNSTINAVTTPGNSLIRSTPRSVSNNVSAIAVMAAGKIYNQAASTVSALATSRVANKYSNMATSASAIPLVRNELLQSQTFDNASWFKTDCTITPDAVTAPDGSLTADTLVENFTGVAQYYVHQFYTTVGAGQTNIASCYAKAGTRGFVRFFWTNYAVTLDLTTGAMQLENATTDIIGWGSLDAGNGWWRVYIVFPKAVGTSSSLFIQACTGYGVQAYNGTVGTTAIYLWGAMAHGGTTLLPYVATTTAAATGTGLLHTLAAVKNRATTFAGQCASMSNAAAIKNVGKLLRSVQIRGPGNNYVSNTTTPWSSFGLTSLTSGSSDPLGGSNALAFVGTAVNGNHYATFAVTATSIPSYENVCISFYAKAGSKTFALLSYYNSNFYVNLTTGTVSGVLGGSSGFVNPVNNIISEDAGGGWWRISVIFQGAAITQPSIGPTSSTSSGTSLGDGSTTDFFLFGVQINDGPTAQTFVPTSGTAVTANVFRAAMSKIFTPFGGGGTTYNQAANAISTVAISILRVARSIRTVSTSIFSSIIKSDNRRVAATSTPVTSNTKSSSKFVILSRSVIASMVSGLAYLRNPTAATTTVLALNKSLGKTLSSVAANVNSIVRSPAKLLNNSMSATSSISKSSTKLFNNTLAVTASIVRSSVKLINRPVTLLSSSSRSTFKLLNNSMIVMASIVKLPTKIFSNSINIVSTTTKSTAKTLINSMNVAPSVVRSFIKLLNNSIIATASFAKQYSSGVLTYNQSALSSSTLASTLTSSKTYLRTMVATILPVSSIIRSLAKMIRGTTLSELVTNGTFDGASYSPFVSYNNSGTTVEAVQIVGGRLRIVTVSSSLDGFYMTLAGLAIGQNYAIECDSYTNVGGSSGLLNVLASFPAQGSAPASTQFGFGSGQTHYRFVFTATATTMYPLWEAAYIAPGSGQYIEFDNISIMEVRTNLIRSVAKALSASTPANLVVNGDFNSAVGFTLTGAATISGGKLTLPYTSPGADQWQWDLPELVPAGTTFTVSFDVDSLCSPNIPAVRFGTPGNGGADGAFGISIGANSFIWTTTGSAQRRIVMYHADPAASGLLVIDNLVVRSSSASTYRLMPRISNALVTTSPALVRSASKALQQTTQSMVSIFKAINKAASTSANTTRSIFKTTTRTFALLTAAISSSLAQTSKGWVFANANTSNVLLRIGFKTPLGNPTGTQTITVQARKRGISGSPTFTISVVETGSNTVLASSAPIAVTSNSGAIYTLNFDASILTVVDGSAVEVIVSSTADNGSTIEYGYVDWIVNHLPAGGVSPNAALAQSSVSGGKFLNVTLSPVASRATVIAKNALVSVSQITQFLRSLSLTRLATALSPATGIKSLARSVTSASVSSTSLTRSTIISKLSNSPLVTSISKPLSKVTTTSVNLVSRVVRSISLTKFSTSVLQSSLAKSLSRTIQATTSQVSILVRSMGRNIASLVTPTGFMAAIKILSQRPQAIATANASTIKQFLKLVLATATQSTTLLRALARLVSVTSPPLATVSRLMNRTINQTILVLASNTPLRFFNRTGLATSNSISSIRKTLARSITASANTIQIIIRSVLLTKTMQTVLVTTINRSKAATALATSTVVVFYNGIKAIIRLFNATSPSVVAFNKLPGKNIQALGTTAASRFIQLVRTITSLTTPVTTAARRLSKSFNIAGSATATRISSAVRAIQASTTNLATLSRISSFFRSFNTNTQAQASKVFTSTKNLLALSIPMGFSVSRSLVRTYQAIATTVATRANAVVSIILRNATLVATISRLAFLSRIIAATSQVQATKLQTLARGLNSTTNNVASLNRIAAMFRTLTATTLPTPTTVRSLVRTLITQTVGLVELTRQFGKSLTTLASGASSVIRAAVVLLTLNNMSQVVVSSRKTTSRLINVISGNITQLSRSLLRFIESSSTVVPNAARSSTRTITRSINVTVFEQRIRAIVRAFASSTTAITSFLGIPQKSLVTSASTMATKQSAIAKRMVVVTTPVVRILRIMIKTFKTTSQPLVQAVRSSVSTFFKTINPLVSFNRTPTKQLVTTIAAVTTIMKPLSKYLRTQVVVVASKIMTVPKTISNTVVVLGNIRKQSILTILKILQPWSTRLSTTKKSFSTISEVAISRSKTTFKDFRRTVRVKPARDFVIEKFRRMARYVFWLS